MRIQIEGKWYNVMEIYQEACMMIYGIGNIPGGYHVEILTTVPPMFNALTPCIESIDYDERSPFIEWLSSAKVYANDSRIVCCNLYLGT